MSPPCGGCSSCINRYIAFANNGFEETLQSTPTRADWFAQWRGRGAKHKLSPSRWVMYVTRWIEAERAFKDSEDSGFLRQTFRLIERLS